MKHNEAFIQLILKRTNKNIWFMPIEIDFMINEEVKWNWITKREKEREKWNNITYYKFNTERNAEPHIRLKDQRLSKGIRIKLLVILACSFARGRERMMSSSHPFRRYNFSLWFLSIFIYENDVGPLIWILLIAIPHAYRLTLHMMMFDT